MKFLNLIYSLFFRSNFFPIVFILTVIGIFWYLIAIPMNTENVEIKFKNLNIYERKNKHHNCKCDQFYKMTFGMK